MNRYKESWAFPWGWDDALDDPPYYIYKIGTKVPMDGVEDKHEETQRDEPNHIRKREDNT